MESCELWALLYQFFHDNRALPRRMALLRRHPLGQDIIERTPCARVFGDVHLANPYPVAVVRGLNHENRVPARKRLELRVVALVGNLYDLPFVERLQLQVRAVLHLQLVYALPATSTAKMVDVHRPHPVDHVRQLFFVALLVEPQIKLLIYVVSVHPEIVHRPVEHLETLLFRSVGHAFLDPLHDLAQHERRVYAPLLLDDLPANRLHLASVLCYLDRLHIQILPSYATALEYGIAYKASIAKANATPKAA